MRKIKKGALRFYQFEHLAEEKNVLHVVTTRAGGVSPPPYDSLNLALHVGDEKARVLENRRRALAAFGHCGEMLVCCQQSHNGNFAFADESFKGRGADDDSGAVPDCDALVTKTRGIVLSVHSEDCPLVILFHAPDTLALVHMGWRCILKRLGATVSRFMIDNLGCKPSGIKAGISPAAGPLSYKVGEDFVARFRDGGVHEDCITSKGKGYYFDLAKASADQVESAGIPKSNIRASGIDTFSTPGEFYSYRRDGVTGRFALMAALI